MSYWVSQSSGLHSNGFSPRTQDRVSSTPVLAVDDIRSTVRDQTVGELLLQPTQLYARAVRDVLNHYKVKSVVHGIAHITGGGLHENLARVLPAHVDAEINARQLDQCRPSSVAATAWAKSTTTKCTASSTWASA